MLFAIRTGNALSIRYTIQSHPLSEYERTEDIPHIKGYAIHRADAHGLKFLALTHTTLFSSEPKSHITKAIDEYSKRVENWKNQLSDFLVSTNVESEFTDIIEAAQRISGTKHLLIGLFARPVEAFFFEKHRGNLSYDERTIIISKKENPKTFDRLYNIDNYLDFWMPSKFGKIHYQAYKLTHRNSYLAVVLLDEENLTELAPFIMIDEFLEVLSNFLMVVRSRRLYTGRALLSELFESDEPASVETLTTRVNQFLSGKRLSWIDEACDLIRQYLRVDACSVFWKHEEPRLVLAGSTHCKELQQAFYNLNNPSLTGKVFKSDRPICCVHVGTHKENSHIFDEDVPVPHESWLGHPIRSKGTRIGVLRLLHKRSPTNRVTFFCGSDIENARMVSNYLAKCYDELSQYAKMYKAQKYALEHQKEAEEAERTTSRFMKSLTHEVQRPIPSIGGLLEYLENLLDKSSISEKYQLVLKIKDCYSCLDLLQVILDTIAHHGGQIIPNYKEIELVEDLLQPLKKMLESAAQVEKKEFLYVPPSSTLWITLDKALTTQILVILLLNAFKYANDDSAVILTVSVTSEGVEFEVEDVGEVIPAGYEKKIFEWEIRGPRIIKKRYPGAGIGLTLAQDIAKALGTEIVVKRREPKTIFAFKLKSGGFYENCMDRRRNT